MPSLLSVRDLVTWIHTDAGEMRAVDGVSFDVRQGKTLGVVGESGSGKSLAALSIMRLLPLGARMSGQVIFEEKDISRAREADMRTLRGRKMAMVFQEPMTSLNPVYTAGHQITEVLRIHKDPSPREAKARALELLHIVGIDAPAARFESYPHELSGGMRQRVMLAMALACEPALLIADEPTTALDVTTQAQILDLLRSVQEKTKMSILFISHDLGLVTEFADDLIVLYGGRVVEQGSVARVFEEPRHPYTEALLRCAPALDAGRTIGDDGLPSRLPTIPGQMPDASQRVGGCQFAARCSYVEPKCRDIEPPLDAFATNDGEAGQERQSRCYFAERVGSA